MSTWGGVWRGEVFSGGGTGRSGAGTWETFLFSDSGRASETFFLKGGFVGSVADNLSCSMTGDGRGGERLGLYKV
jgi:hypothetical protein